MAHNSEYIEAVKRALAAQRLDYDTMPAGVGKGTLVLECFYSGQSAIECARQIAVKHEQWARRVLAVAEAEREYNRDLLLRSRNGQVGSGMMYRG